MGSNQVCNVHLPFHLRHKQVDSPVWVKLHDIANLELHWPQLWRWQLVRCAFPEVITQEQQPKEPAPFPSGQAYQGCGSILM